MRACRLPKWVSSRGMSWPVSKNATTTVLTITYSVIFIESVWRLFKRGGHLIWFLREKIRDFSTLVGR